MQQQFSFKNSPSNNIVDYVSDTNITNAYGSITNTSRSLQSLEYDKESERESEKDSDKETKKESGKERDKESEEESDKESDKDSDKESDISSFQSFVNPNIEPESDKNFFKCKNSCDKKVCKCNVWTIDATESIDVDAAGLHRANIFIQKIIDMESSDVEKDDDIKKPPNPADFSERQELGDIFMSDTLQNESLVQTNKNEEMCTCDPNHQTIDCMCSGNKIIRCEEKYDIQSYWGYPFEFTEELIQNVVYTESNDFSHIAARSAASVSIDDPRLRTYFTPDEVVVHNTPDDVWVSYLGNVYDLTPLVEKYKDGKEIKPILAFAGKDISDWFDKNGELRHYIHPITGVRVPYLPHGPIPDIRPHVPTTAWRPTCCCEVGGEKDFLPWWRDKKYLVGVLTKRARPIRILNMLTIDECTLTVCCEDTLNRILERLLLFNKQATSYTFKYDTRVLDMNKTLDENRIFDERDDYLEHFLPDDTYIPAICLYFNDDLEWDLDSD